MSDIVGEDNPFDLSIVLYLLICKYIDNNMTIISINNVMTLDQAIGYSDKYMYILSYKNGYGYTV